MLASCSRARRRCHTGTHMRLPFAAPSPPTLAIAALCLSLNAPPQAALADASAIEIFEAKCVACHAGGGNVLNPGKTLAPAALERNGYTSEESIVNLLRNGKGQMPKYQGAIPPVSRLSDEELAAVARYVLDESQKGWPVP